MANINLIGIGDWGLGIGDWGLGIGDWAQSPIPNPQEYKNILNNYKKINKIIPIYKFFLIEYYKIIIFLYIIYNILLYFYNLFF